MRRLGRASAQKVSGSGRCGASVCLIAASMARDRRRLRIGIAGAALAAAGARFAAGFARFRGPAARFRALRVERKGLPPQGSKACAQAWRLARAALRLAFGIARLAVGASRLAIASLRALRPGAKACARCLEACAPASALRTQGCMRCAQAFGGVNAGAQVGAGRVSTRGRRSRLRASAVSAGVLTWTYKERR